MKVLIPIPCAEGRLETKTKKNTKENHVTICHPIDGDPSQGSEDGNGFASACVFRGPGFVPFRLSSGRGRSSELDRFIRDGSHPFRAQTAEEGAIEHIKARGR